MDDKLPPQLVRLMDQSKNTLEALRRGESPPCPWCGAPCEGKYDNWNLNGEAIWRFACGSNVQRVMRSDGCYERELDALRAECERLRNALQRAIELYDEGTECYCNGKGAKRFTCSRCAHLRSLEAALGEEARDDK